MAVESLNSKCIRVHFGEISQQLILARLRDNANIIITTFNEGSPSVA